MRAVVGGRPPISLKFALKVTHPLWTQWFRPISAHSASTITAAEKSSISTNIKSTTRFLTSHRWTVYVIPKSPNGWHKTRFCYFLPVKFNFCRKKSATKFLCVKTSSDNVIATTYPYLTVHRRITSNVPIIYIQFALKVTHPFRKRRFRKISLNSVSAVKASEKVHLSLIGSRKCAFHQNDVRPRNSADELDEPCALPWSPPKGGSKQEFLHLALPFIPSLQVIVDTSNLPRQLGRVVLACRLPAAAKLTVVLTSRCDLVTEALASLLSGFIEALSTLTVIWMIQDGV